ncbi:2OG-Fe(II) oxygenase superfamily domain-containing protein [Ditylenchus destructor]|uniref:hypoxia-inducible factor-proline dioxygenase n=1 Tax=Ditylenchus destructor TaxID=166010 RepID=A0AAD4RAE1_9BILA|nr:2OG-Fe(II) oxygenase superfamily domain-containing protein [Ditylenchus destructor]
MFCSASSSTEVPSTSHSIISGSIIKEDVCNFCRATTGPNSEPLIRCPDCQVAAYCGLEHKEFDYKRHKLLCYQWRRKKRQDLEVGSNAESTRSSVTTTNSTQPSTSSEFSSEGYRIIETDDPDVQIIESTTSKMSDLNSTNKRKRALDTAEKAYKDHSKNLLFKTTLQQHIKNLADNGLIVNQHQAIALRLRYIAEHVIRSLNEYGWAVVDNFLGKAHCKHTYMEVERLYKKGFFSAGQLMDGGRDDSGDPHDIRSDKIYWFDSAHDSAKESVTIRLLISMIDSVIVHFNDRIPPYKISGRSRAMIAVYPGNGTRYVKHVDNPIADGRCITTIYYCNEDWNLADHGGTLRLYPESSKLPMDIDPQADRIIFFWSDRRNPHEVLPVYRHRYAITIWYFDYAERHKALELKQKMTENGNSQDTTATMNITPSTSQNNFLPNGDSQRSPDQEMPENPPLPYLQRPIFGLVPNEEALISSQSQPNTSKSQMRSKNKDVKNIDDGDSDSSAADIDEIIAEAEKLKQVNDFEI